MKDQNQNEETLNVGILVAIDREMNRLVQLREVVLQAGPALLGVHIGNGIEGSRLFQVHVNDGVDPRPIARALGTGWVKDGTAWRGCKVLGDFEVILHNAEPGARPSEAVEL